MTQVYFSTKLLSKLFCNLSLIVIQILGPHSAIETMTQTQCVNELKYSLGRCCSISNFTECNQNPLSRYRFN